MRAPVYLIGIASCLVLSWILGQRENWLGLVLVLLAALAYTVRLVTTTRAARREAVERATGPRVRSSAEQEELKAELRGMREAYERNRRVLLLIAVVIAGVAAVVWSRNEAFALALLLFTLPALVLAWRNGSAVRRIDDGLSRAR